MEFKHPFTGIVAGPTGSGKTYFVRKFLNRKPVNVKFDEVIWCYGEWQSLYKEIKATFHKGILDTLPTDDKPRLLVVDDLMHEADKRVVDLFTKGSHHRNISVLFITQNLFHQKSGARDISLNAHYMVIFKNPRDAAQISYLGRQITPENPKFLVEAYRDATANPHGYLLIDLKQDTPDVLRFRTNIFDKNMIAKARPDLRKTLVQMADEDVIRAICECADNTLKGHVNLTSVQKRRLARYKKTLRRLVKRGEGWKKKRDLILQSGGFLLPLLAPVLGSVLAALIP
ncbi:hypothetical protein B566_EDAN002898 [Ephemera danica]|nr:hypothetical protein B566_EDAN002898 [Ephemera danica]